MFKLLKVRLTKKNFLNNFSWEYFVIKMNWGSKLKLVANIVCMYTLASDYLKRYIHSRDDYYCIYAQPISSSIFLYHPLFSLRFHIWKSHHEVSERKMGWDSNDTKKKMQIIINAFFLCCPFTQTHKNN